MDVVVRKFMPLAAACVVGLLEEWPTTTGEELARLKQISKFDTDAIRLAVARFALRALQGISSLVRTDEIVNKEGIITSITYRGPSFAPGVTVWLAAGKTGAYIDDRRGERIVCLLMRYLFDVPDELQVRSSRFYANWLSRWYYNAPIKLTSKDRHGHEIFTFDTLWPFERSGNGAVKFVWPDDYQPRADFEQRQILMGASATADNYLAAFEYCCKHFKRREVV